MRCLIVFALALSACAKDTSSEKASAAKPLLSAWTTQDPAGWFALDLTAAQLGPGGRASFTFTDTTVCGCDCDITGDGLTGAINIANCTVTSGPGNCAGAGNAVSYTFTPGQLNLVMWNAAQLQFD